MTELTQEELNGLSPRARKALGADNMIQEIVEVNPNADRLKKVTTKKSKKKGNKNEKL
jgi:hypothetical protein|tara:strand:- start:130 stop:303 length:174 start_codon:yes stop_codon:yes gene_type:complete